MFKITGLLKKTALAALLLAIALAAFPVTGTSAAGLDQTPIQPNNVRLVRVWMRQQALYQRQSEHLADASTFIARVQGLIDRTNTKMTPAPPWTAPGTVTPGPAGFPGSSSTASHHPHRLDGFPSFQETRLPAVSLFCSTIRNIKTRGSHA